MPDRRSEVDSAVLAIRSKVEHEFEGAVVDGQNLTICVRCGQPSGDLIVAEGPGAGGFRPCRGFVG